MPAIETQIWLALKARIDTLVTSPTMPKYDPDATFTPPSSGGVLQPFILVSDVRNDNRRITIGPGLHARSGTLMLSIHWPASNPIAHAALLQIAGKVAAHFPADLRMKYGSCCLRVTRDSDSMQPYRDGIHTVSLVKVYWSTT
jgi:hypothetical protein